MNSEILTKIKHANIDKERKWMYNFAKAAHKCIEENDFTKLNRTVNNYFKHHTEGYFNKTYNNMTEKQKAKHKKDCAERQKLKKYNTERQKQMYAAYQLFSKGQLSDKSTKMINKKYEEEY